MTPVYRGAHKAEAMTTQERVSEIKRQLRSLMNGAAVRSMREKGAGCGAAFGVEAPRLAGIAAATGKDAGLAEALWNENVRECRILALMIHPHGAFPPEKAAGWISSMRSREEAQYASLHLLQHLPYAESGAFEWMADGREMFRLCGFLTIGRLLFKGLRLGSDAEKEFLAMCRLAFRSGGGAVSKAACNALLKYSEQDEEHGEKAGRIFGECGGEDGASPKPGQNA